MQRHRQQCQWQVLAYNSFIDDCYMPHLTMTASSLALVLDQARRCSR